MLNFADVRRFRARGNVIPLVLRMSSDLHTPVSAYLRLAAERPVSFLLESVEGGERLARYSILGFDPYCLVSAWPHGLRVREGEQTTTISGSPVAGIETLFSRFHAVRIEGLPRFTGGAVGYFGYDTVRWLERLPDRHPRPAGSPDARLGFYRHIVVFDHARQEILLIYNLFDTGKLGDLRFEFERGRTSLERTARRLQAGSAAAAPRTPIRSNKVTSNTSRSRFAQMVESARRYIYEGDIFQVVLSRRWETESGAKPLEVYRQLRRINPSPYMFLLQFGKEAVIGASPEMLARIEDGAIETRPIAGTRPRGRSDEEDRRLAEELLADPKERAEHTMLVDLGRNDLGRVALPGSVHVPESMLIEKYSHVLHIVSSVKGKLRPDVSPLRAMLACFPAGTVSGAPKIRAMEIIDQLERERRGLYAGCIAYLDFHGNLDSCIAIRTLVKSGRKYLIQAGAGIVADSDPQREAAETEAKARVMQDILAGKYNS